MSKNSEFKIELAERFEDLKAIHTLQKRNLAKNISVEEIKSQGFVTVDHELGLLERMNKPFPHIIARLNEQVIGYALVMTKDLKNEIPILVPMFEKINSIIYKGVSLENSSYVVMGQVCIDKPHRGKGLFARLYSRMQTELCSNFQYIITEISPSNTRSIRAHNKIGFKEILKYEDKNSNTWVIVLLEI